MWTPSPVVTDYRISRSPDPDGTFLEIGSSSHGVFVDFDVRPGETWYYVLDADCRDGAVVRSGVTAATIPRAGRGRR